MERVVSTKGVNYEKVSRVFITWKQNCSLKYCVERFLKSYKVL